MLTGGCYCGDVRYETDGAPFHETICHCPDCRRIAGTPTVAWFSVPAASLRFTAGEPVRFNSSPGVTRSFCGRCGTHLTFQQDDLADEIDITIASLDQPDRVVPRDHTRTRHKLSWDAVCDGLPAYLDTRSEGAKQG